MCAVANSALTPESSSRSRLLEAGVGLLTKPGPGLARRGVTADAVASAAGVARRTFYDQFEAMELYLEALEAQLVTRLFSVRTAPALTLSSVEGDLGRLIVHAVEDHLQREHAASLVATALAFLGSTEEVPALEDCWPAVVDELQELGLRPTGIKPSGIVDAIRQQIRGAIHGRQAPPDAELVASTAASVEQILAALTEASDDHTITDTQMRRRRITTLWAENLTDVAIPNVRALALRATEDLISRRGALGITVDSVAAATGLSRSVLNRHAGGLEGIYGALIDEIAAGLDVKIGADLARGATPVTALQRHFLRLVELTRSRPAYGVAVTLLADGHRRVSRSQSDLQRTVKTRLLTGLDEATAELAERLLDQSVHVQWSDELQRVATQWLSLAIPDQADIDRHV